MIRYNKSESRLKLDELNKYNKLYCKYFIYPQNHYYRNLIFKYDLKSQHIYYCNALWRDTELMSDLPIRDVNKDIRENRFNSTPLDIFLKELNLNGTCTDYYKLVKEYLLTFI